MSVLSELDKDYINEDHIHSFAKALVWEELVDLLEMTPNVRSANSILRTALITDEKVPQFSELYDQNHLDADLLVSRLNQIKPDLITSKSDWYPITNSIGDTYSTLNHKKYHRTSLKSAISKLRDEFRSSASYTLLRWPILFFVGLWMGFLCILYLSIRVYVALLEYFFTWTGARKKLRDKLRASRTYDEWINNAVELDKYLGLDKWSINPRFSYYDYRTLKLSILRMKALKKENNDEDLLVLLQGCLKKNFAGIENEQLYSHRYYGSKDLVEQYYKEVVDSINKVTDSPNITTAQKRKFFRIVLKNYGKSALCLSGGACFSYIHFGIVKAMLDNDLLPSIISGTSGGGLVAALTCCRTDDELRELLVPQLARKITACEDPWNVWIPRWWKTGARFDAVTWARKSCFFTRGSLTFQDAYKRTGRKLNISTVPADPHSPVILCNNITSPNCIIWSSLLASSAVPGILNPVVLMTKNPKSDEIVPFSLGSKWRDGSLRTDIPVDSLNTYYNVNFPIVSQVNPHIALFFFAPKGSVGRPVSIPRRKTKNERYAVLRGGFIAAALEQVLKLEIKKWLQIIKSLDLLPHVMEQDWLNIWLQTFSGAITVWPRIRIKDFWYILSDPTEEQLEEMIIKGQRSMFPRLLFIKHRNSIERAIERGRAVAKLSNEITRSSSEGLEKGSDFEVHDAEYEDDNDDEEYDDFEGDETDNEIEFQRRLSVSEEEIQEIEKMDEQEYDLSPSEVYSDSGSTDQNQDSSFLDSIFGNGSPKKKSRRNTVF